MEQSPIISAKKWFQIILGALFCKYKKENIMFTFSVSNSYISLLRDNSTHNKTRKKGTRQTATSENTVVRNK